MWWNTVSTKLLGLVISCEVAVSGKGPLLGQFYPSDIVWFKLALSFPTFTPMASSQLPNYLLANRKRLALSQDDVAFLLGTQSGAKICRYERFVRVPSLETALAYEAIFKRSVSELFGGLYRKTEGAVAERAKTLIERTNRRKPNQQTTRRREALTDLAIAQLP